MTLLWIQRQCEPFYLRSAAASKPYKFFHTIRWERAKQKNCNVYRYAALQPPHTHKLKHLPPQSTQVAFLLKYSDVVCFSIHASCCSDALRIAANFIGWRALIWKAIYNIKYKSRSSKANRLKKITPSEAKSVEKDVTSHTRLEL